MTRRQRDAKRTSRGCSNWLRYSTLALLVLAVLGPILPGVELAGFSLFPFRLVLPVYLGTLLVQIHQSDYAVELPPGSGFLLAFVALGVSVTLVAFPSFFAVRGFVLFASGFALFLGIVLTLDTRRWIYRGWVTLTALALLAFLLAGIEIGTGWHASASQIHELPDRPPYSGYVTAWFANVNDLSFFLVFATIPAFVSALRSNRQSARISSLAVWMVAFFLATRLGARAITLGFVIVGVTAVGIVYLDGVRDTLGRIPVRVGRIAVPLVGLFVAGVFAVVPNPLSSVGSSLWTRWQLQKASVTVAGFVGNGFGSSPTAIQRSAVATDGIVSPHSWYGALLTDTGFLGLLCFLVFYGGLVVGLFRQMDGRDPVYVTSGIAVVSLPVAGLGPSNAVLHSTFWIVLGLSVSTLALSAEPNSG